MQDEFDGDQQPQTKRLYTVLCLNVGGSSDYMLEFRAILTGPTLRHFSEIISPIQANLSDSL